MRDKIVLPEQIDRSRGKLVLCQGCFDLLHIGHIKHLHAAKKFGDILAVAVTADKFVNKGPGRPAFNQQLRMEQLSSLEIVDYVLLSDDSSAVPILKAVKPDFYVKGSEYRNLEEDVTGKILIEKETIEQLGGQLVFTDEITFSSTNLLNKFFNPLHEGAKVFLNSLDFTVSDVLYKLSEIEKLKILVIGETIFDKYTFVDVMNVAAKHSVLSTRFQDTEIQYGGVLATARHLAQFTNNVSVLTVLDDCTTKEVKYALPYINIISVSSSKERTITKERFLDEKGNQLFRLEFLNDAPYYVEAPELIKNIDASKYDIIIINDFGHGMITETVRNYISTINGPFIALNVQTNSANKGFNLVSKYRYADYISIDLPEARLATRDKHGNIKALASKLFELINYETLSITHGKYGTTVFQRGKSVTVPVFSTEVVDTTGAGDAYFAITSPLAYLKAPIEMLGLVGNAVGALAIKIVGNRSPINPTLLKKYINTLMK